MKSVARCIAFCLVDAEESVLDLSCLLLLSIVIEEALVELLSLYRKVPCVSKSSINEAEVARMGPGSRLRTFSVVQLPSMNNEPFGKRKTSGEGFGRKLLGLQCLHL